MSAAIDPALAPQPSRDLDICRTPAAFPPETARTLRLAVDLHIVMAALEAAGIEVLAFKGPTLAALSYGRLDRAASSDLDLLVRRTDMARSLDVLRKVGYSMKGASDAPSLPGNNEVVLTCAGLAEVDLHWELSPVYFFRFDLEGAFGRAQVVTLIGKSFRTLGNEDLFLGLAIHHSRHCWNSEQWVRDVANLARSQSLDWERIDGLAASSRTRRVVNLAVLLATLLAPESVPASVVGRARADRSAVQLSRQVQRNLQHSKDDVAGTLEGAYMQVRMAETACDGLRYLWRRLVLPNQIDAETLQLPRSMWPLYFALRPFRLLSKIARRAIGE